MSSNNCVLVTMFEQSGILAGKCCCGCGRRSGTDSGERAILSRVSCKERRALAVNGGALEMDDETRTLQEASGKGRSRISDTMSERVGAKGVCGAVATRSCGHIS